MSHSGLCFLSGAEAQSGGNLPQGRTENLRDRAIHLFTTPQELPQRDDLSEATRSLCTGPERKAELSLVAVGSN